MGAVFTSCTRAAYWKVGLPYAGDDGYRFSALAAAPPRYNPVTRLQLTLHAPPTHFPLANPLSLLFSRCHRRGYYSSAEYSEELRGKLRGFLLLGSGIPILFSQFPLPIFPPTFRNTFRSSILKSGRLLRCPLSKVSEDADERHCKGVRKVFYASLLSNARKISLQIVAKSRTISRETKERGRVRERELRVINLFVF